MEQIFSWASQSQLNYVVTILILGPIPLTILYFLLKRKYDSGKSFLLAALIISIPLFVLSIVTLDNPPYFLFALLGVALIILFYQIKTKGKD